MAKPPRRKHMRSIRNLVVVAASILAVSGCTAASPAASPKAFQLDKTCVAETNVCTVVSSDITALPPGSEIAYTAIGDGSNGLLAASIAVENGSTLGVCDFNYDGDPLAAKCTFTTGTGELTGFHLAADVTVTPEQSDPEAVWHWVGTYWFDD
jgi:hypothetical protein